MLIESLRGAFTGDLITRRKLLGVSSTHMRLETTISPMSGFSILRRENSEIAEEVQSETESAINEEDRDYRCPPELRSNIRCDYATIQPRR